MPLHYSIIIASFSIFCFIFGLAFSMANFKRRHKMAYSIRNMFPFEFNYQGLFVDNLLGNMFLMVSGLSLIVTFATFNGSRTDGYTIFILIASIISAVLISANYFINTKTLKLWALSVVLSYAMIFMLIAAIAILHLKYYQQTHQVLNLVGLIYSIVLALAAFVLAMNPKLSFRIKAKEKPKTNPEEETKYERPKWIPLAFSIWIVTILLYLSQIGIILFSASIS